MCSKQQGYYRSSYIVDRDALEVFAQNPLKGVCPEHHALTIPLAVIREKMDGISIDINEGDRTTLANTLI